jgi:hypothetical protein
MPIGGPDKQSSSAEPKKPATEDLDPTAEEGAEDTEESKDAVAKPDKRTWQ